MRNPLVLYSTTSWLAYKIAQVYYRDEHYVWCTPCFSVKSLPAWERANPPSSCPREIYNTLFEESVRGDRHGLRIAMNKAGILRGAHVKEKRKIINRDQKAEIFSVVDCAETRDFKPLVFVIPFARVARSIELVSVSDRAHPLSAEYIIQRLPRKCFDIIEFDQK